jgi:hypothetical protein
MRRSILAAVTLPAFTLAIVGALAQVLRDDRSICCSNHRSASARLGENGVHPNFQCIQTGTPWEPLS